MYSWMGLLVITAYYYISTRITALSAKEHGMNLNASYTLHYLLNLLYVNCFTRKE